jgi:hypothetical protein
LQITQKNDKSVVQLSKVHQGAEGVVADSKDVKILLMKNAMVAIAGIALYFCLGESGLIMSADFKELRLTERILVLQHGPWDETMSVIDEHGGFNQSFTAYWSDPRDVRRHRDGALYGAIGGAHKLLFIETNFIPGDHYFIDSATRNFGRDTSEVGGATGSKHMQPFPSSA